MSSEVIIGSGPILNGNWTRFFAEVIDKVTDRVIEIIKTPGFAPVGDKEYDPNSGALRKGHKAIWEGKVSKKVISEMDYWKWVVINHRVLTTQKALRWWFGYFLKQHPDFQRKTVGPPRWVPADEYQIRAINHLMNSGIIEDIVSTELRKYLGGSS